MTPEQIRACREGLRLSQVAFGRQIGVGRMSINHYENGRRHDTKQPIEISKTADMACSAAWLGIDGFSEVMTAAENADSQVGNAAPVLPSNAVPAWHLEAALDEIRRRGFEIGQHVLAFPLLQTIACWPQIITWCPERGYPIPKLYPVVSARVPGVAILEFPTSEGAVLFRNFCTGGK